MLGESVAKARQQDQALQTARLFFAVGALLCVAGTTLIALLPFPHSAATRATLCAACLALALAFVWARQRVGRAGVALLLRWLVAGMCLLLFALAVGSEHGLRTVSLGYLALALCLTAVLAGPRTAFALAGLCVAGIGGVAWLELSGRLHTIEALSRAPAADSIVAHMLLLSGGLATGVMMSRVAERAYREAAIREASYRELFERSLSPTVVLRQGLLVDANPAALALFGVPQRSDLVGRALLSFYEDEPDDSRHRGAHQLERLAQSAVGAVASSELFRLRRPDGSRRIVAASGARVDGAEGPASMLLYADETERHAAEQALAEAWRAAEAANQAKSAFLANTSHEIRTPLNGLLGLARLAQQAEVSDLRRRRYLDQIAQSAQSLALVITDILDLAKIEAGKLQPEFAVFDLSELLRQLHLAYAPLAAERGLTLRLEAEGLPQRVRGDPLRLRQILVNYLHNALKFTEQGGLVLRAQVQPGGRVQLAVDDSGPGIAPELLPRLFQPFTQADDSVTRRHGGTGLGLAICRELATLMGGEVGVQALPGQGSRFWVALPLPGSDEPLPAPAGGPIDPQRTLVGSHVLVVEDNEVNMMICVAVLQQQGVRVAQATGGREALAAVARAGEAGDPFHAVLMDVQMPEMSGHETTRRLRERHDAATLPVIAITAAALVAERDKALASGMTDFLTKPIEPSQLLAALERAIRPPPAA